MKIIYLHLSEVDFKSRVFWFLVDGRKYNVTGRVGIVWTMSSEFVL